MAMLIDDDEESNFVNNWIIKQSFAKDIMVLSSAQNALEYLKTHSDSVEQLPDVIFLDIRMPLMDGFEFLEEFNKLSDTVRNKCKIIVLSSSFDKRDYDKVMNNEYVHQYLIKPLSMDALKEI